MRIAFAQSGQAYGPPINPAVVGAFGLGSLGLNQQLNEIGAIASTGAATTGALVSILSASAAAGPIGAAIGGVIAIGFAIANAFKGCGPTCVAATQIADQVGVILTDNLHNYMDAPIHYRSLQLAALNNFDTAAAAMMKACGDPALGAAGQRCISERLVRGGTAPWCDHPGQTGCDWVTVLRDPIANDPNVVPDPVTPIVSTDAAGQTTVAGLPMPILLGGAALLILAMMGGK